MKTADFERKTRHICKVEEDPMKKQVGPASELGLPVPTLNIIIGKREETRKKLQVFETSVKQTRGAQHEQMEEILLAWFKKV